MPESAPAVPHPITVKKALQTRFNLTFPLAKQTQKLLGANECSVYSPLLKMVWELLDCGWVYKAFAVNRQQGCLLQKVWIQHAPFRLQ